MTTTSRPDELQKLRAASAAAADILKETDSTAAAAALIAKWRHCDLGPNPLVTAASLEARNRVFGWGR